MQIHRVTSVQNQLLQATSVESGIATSMMTVRQNRLPYAAGQGLAGAAAPIRETSRWPMTRTAPAQPIYFAVIEGISNFEDVTPSGNGPSSLLIVEGRFVLIFQLPLTFL